MKIYTATKKYNTGIDVGMILVKDDKVYFESHFKVCSENESDGHLMGIWRGLSVIKNYKRDTNLERVECIIPNDLKGWVDLRLREDRYTRHLKRQLRVDLTTVSIKEDDEKYIELVKKQCQLNHVVIGKTSEGR